MVVSQLFKEAGFPDAITKMGMVQINHEVEPTTLDEIEKQLNKVGFELINDAKSRLIEQIKQLAIEYVYQNNHDPKESFSDYLSKHLNHSYNYLSSLYSSVEGITIEKHLINLKIERVKELLVYDEKSLSEIAFEMGYSSVAHLSGQFKKVTGFTPSYFKHLAEHRRKSLDEIR